MSLLADLPRRARIGALFGVVTVVGGAAVFGFRPLVRAGVEQAAQRRGVRVDVGQIRIGLGAIWLNDIDVFVPKMPGVTAHIDALRVGISWRLNVRELALHGASVELHGDADELRQQLAAYRADRPKEPAGKGGVSYLADGIDLVWDRARRSPVQRVWGLRYQRGSDIELVALDLARGDAAGVQIEASHLRARLRRLNEERQLESLQGDALELGVSLEPVATSGAVTPGQTAPFQGDPTRGVKLRAGLTELAELAGRALPEGAALDLQRVRLRFQRGTERLGVGPSAFRVERREAELGLSLIPKTEGEGTPLAFRVSVPLSRGEVRAEVRGGPVSLRSLGVRDGDFGLVGVRNATLQARGEVTLPADGASLSFSGDGVLDQLSLARSELSPSVLSGIHLAFRARGSSTLDGAELALDDAELALGDVRFQGRGNLRRTERDVQAHWTFGVPLASCQALLDATPRGLVPLIAPLRMTGTFAVNAGIDYGSLRASDTRVHLEVANDCRIGQIPPDLSPHRFASAWQREVKGPDKLPMEIESGPGSPDWVPYDSISPFMEAAVLVCEDGHFERHRGFDYEAIQNSIRDDLIQGRFVRGASTISMQLAKNLYLGKEKTLGRKLQEAVLTLLLEQELSKQELLELYLNVIEYGPGIYGIGPAARYYFAKRASDLSLGQALYIASILPNPERQHFDRDGRVSTGWTRYLQRLMVIARKIGKVSDEQLAAGLNEQVAFRVADSGGAVPVGVPSAEEGTDTPSELAP